MGFLFFLALPIILSSASLETEAQGIKSARLLDLYIRDYTVRSFDQRSRTGILHNVQLPANFSGIKVGTARFRCGSLKRYGALVKEFHLNVGVTVNPCVERVMLVTQHLGENWSILYYSNYDLAGYQLLSPILGLLAYNGGVEVNFSNPYELGIFAGEKPITVDFRNTTRALNNSVARPLCASFEGDGKVTLAKEVSPYVCSATRHGHFGLVTEEPQPVQLGKKESRWKVAMGSSIGAAIGAFLLGLLLVAIFVRVRKRSRMEELVRRAYEEEALQVSMVGHVKAPTALATRTLPTIEHDYVPPH